MSHQVILNNGKTRFVSFVFWDEVYIVRYTITGPVVNTDDILEATEDVMVKSRYSVYDCKETIAEVMSRFDVEYEIVSDETLDIGDIINNA